MKTSYGVIASILGLLLCGPLVLGACGSGDDAPAASQAAAGDLRGPEGGPQVLGSLPEFSLTDQQGGAFGSEDLRGRLWVSDFIFTRCPDMCPRLTREMVELQKALAADPSLGDVRLVSFSVDPEYDRPPILAEYAAKHGADAERWTFLTGPTGELRQLIRDGFKLPVEENTGDAGNPLLHSNKFVLADRDGRIRGYYDGLDGPSTREQLLSDARAVAGETSTAAAPSAAGSATVEIVAPPDADPDWLASRAAAQQEAVAGLGAFHDFRFTDRLPQSGITFEHAIVDDAGKSYKGVHYDHGNGVVVADVDGDGHTDIYFVNQLGNNGLWRNLGDGTFEDITWEANVPVFDRVSVSAAFADVDNDGDPDLYVTTVRGPNVLFENDGKGVFKDVSSTSGLDYEGHSSGTVFFDYNRDGLLDLYLLNIGEYTTDARGPGRYYVGHKDAFSGHLKPERTERSILFENQGGNRFVDVSEKVGLQDESWSGDATAVDLNEDGWPDLYVLNMQGPDQYYENVGGKKFVRRSEELFPKTSWGAMGVKAFDFDNDGDQDIFISDMHSDMAVNDVPPNEEKLKMQTRFPDDFLKDGGNGIYGNTFFRNDGDEKFSEISDEIGTENFWPWGLSVSDLNADGYDDVFVASSMNYPFRYGVNSLLLNDGGEKFADTEFVLGVEPRREGRTSKPWFEVDCAGVDRYHVNCKDRPGAGRTLVKGALGTRSSVIFDLDEDGDLDIVTNEFGDVPMVLISNLGEKRPIRYLEVKLAGKKSNRSGIGARVRVRAGDDTYTKVLDGKSGYLSQSELPLYFGLGGHEQVDEIEVLWPSGHVQKLGGPIGTNTRIEIEEGA